jgi:uncharacterized membrane protein YbhN (UPF0104 family)
LAGLIQKLDDAAHRLVAAADSPGWLKIRRLASQALPVILLVVALWVMWREFRHLTPAEVTEEALGWGAARTAGAAGLTVASFALLVLIERLGMRWAGIKAPWTATLTGGFCANAFGHVVGFALIVGAATRLRLYARHGATLLQATQASVFYGMAFGGGMALLGGIALLADPMDEVGQLPLAPWLVKALAGAMLVAPALYVGLCARLRGEGSFLGHTLSMPPPGVAALQILLGLANCAVTAGVVWLLLPHGAIGYPAFVSSFVPATLLGLASHVPGGAGVFEGTVLTLLPELSRATLAAAFLGYRLIYYAAPLMIAAVVLALAGGRRPTANAPTQM